MTIQASDTTNEHPTTTTGNGHDILDIARQQVLKDGIGLTQAQLEEVLRLPDEALPAALELAHQVRLRHCGKDVEVEGIISIKTGGCPEDCHFLQPVGALRLPRPRRLAGHPGTGQSRQGNRRHRSHRVLHRCRCPRTRHQADEPDQVRH
jgi:hypothetical protein